ncbi:MAG: 50S ribosomal protein L21 [Candidatus Lloydbacteria bacterium RIFCSPHIGHO2_01_FULL_41_20]|uniref:Large ribosomal subunit protein bL21 n=1 Tax=Candidatus Lloydbacteria bacterium RIFCSPHIGHO2_01_FULL_41_20 TaxID=1798657 RepID=A0A1G2CSY1_9BACT|nr:MAG: 50S ribosomal protein L21 [Candidatus Lloydbacteria bacterium RIFCSPHIGHO2_01_FULL_41_20]
MNFVIIETGGKQYKVSEGDSIKIEKLSGRKEGDKVVFDKVLLTDDGKGTEIGSPYLSGVSVSGTIKKEDRADKVEVMKYKAKSRYKKVRGHRQPYMLVEIESIK